MGFGDISGSNRATQATINAVGPPLPLVLSVGGYGSAGFTLAAGTLAATIIPEVSFDGKDTWMPWEFEDPQTGQKLSALTVTNPNAASSWSIHPPGGTTHVRINVTAYTSGSATAILVLTEMSRPARRVAHSRFVLSQGVAGTTLVAEAVAGKQHKVLGILISLANDGVWHLDSGATPLMGNLKQDGQLQPAVMGPSEIPLVETVAGAALNIVTTQAAQGVIVFVTE